MKSINRRQFAQGIASTAIAASIARTEPAHAAQNTVAKNPLNPLSIMLWTVWTDLPFDQRLANVAKAGYSNVELVGEYNEWSDADYSSAISASKHLGIHFDATAGLHNGVGNPAARDAFLAEFKQALTPMQTLGCPTMIILSGNVVSGLSREAQHQSCIEGLKRAAEIIEGKQIDGQRVRLLLECIDPEENPHNHPQVQFLYDLFHEQIAEGNLIEKLDKHIDVIGLIHVADVPGRHQPGTGEINYENIYRKLAALNYRHAIAMEFHPIGDPVATLHAAKQMVVSAMGTA
jgi:hydroxypyruvate isomerase